MGVQRTMDNDQPKSKPGQIWKCRDTNHALYIVRSDKRGNIFGELWLGSGVESDSRGHSQGEPDKDQEFIADSIYDLVKPMAAQPFSLKELNECRWCKKPAKMRYFGKDGWSIGCYNNDCEYRPILLVDEFETKGEALLSWNSPQP